VCHTNSLTHLAQDFVTNGALARDRVGVVVGRHKGEVVAHSARLRPHIRARGGHASKGAAADGRASVATQDALRMVQLQAPSKPPLPTWLCVPWLWAHACQLTAVDVHNVNDTTCATRLAPGPTADTPDKAVTHHPPDKAVTHHPHTCA
jgi:hypothetical protein